jgi:type VI protein secretion system component Hcp
MSQPASSPLHYFIKLDGVTGDATVNGTPGWIAIDGFDWGVTNSSSFATGGGGGAGKATFSPLTVDFHSLAGLATPGHYGAWQHWITGRSGAPA